MALTIPARAAEDKAGGNPRIAGLLVNDPTGVRMQVHERAGPSAGQLMAGRRVRV